MGVIINLKSTDTGLVDRSDNTARFYNDIRRYDVFTAEEEKKWFTLYKNGTKEEKELARQTIINANQRLVVAVAKKYADTDTLMDYVNEINFGLMEAIENFDVDRGVRFQSFCLYYFKRAVNNYNVQYANIVKKSNLCKTFSISSKVYNSFVQENERVPTMDELVDYANNAYDANIKDKRDLYDVTINRIDETYDNDDDARTIKDIYDFNKFNSSTNSYERQAEKEFSKELVSSLMNVLSPRERKLIELRFGLVEYNGTTREHELYEIAEALELTTERVRQMEREILHRLRKEYHKRLNKLL